MEDINKKLDKLDNHMEAIKHLLTNLNDTLEAVSYTHLTLPTR